jgi:hypothetical protein
MGKSEENSLRHYNGGHISGVPRLRADERLVAKILQALRSG